MIRFHHLNSPPVFQPIELQLTIETRGDLEHLVKVFGEIPHGIAPDLYSYLKRKLESSPK